jgi:ferredoxin
MLDTIERIAPQIRMERYQAKLPASVPNGAGGKVRFAKSGVESRADGRTALLVVAENAGIAAPHGCRMGICHSCDTTLVSGCVRDLRTGNDITECGARVQVCVSAAAGDVELDL